MHLSKARSRAARILAAAAVTAATWALPGTEPAGAAIDAGATALQLAQAMATDPTVITGASFVAKPPNGTPTAVADTGTPLGGFPLNGTTYAILSTGNATWAANPSSSLASANNGGGTVRGNSDLDVVILKVDVNVPANANCATVGVFKFLSEEYPQYVGQMNDAFVAELDSSTWTTSGGSISAPNNFAFDNNGNAVSVNSSGTTSMSSGNAAGTVYGGATMSLTASTPITPGNHSLYFSIFDQGDNSWDSAVFLDDFKLSNVTPGSCTAGATVPPLPLETKKTADSPFACLNTINGYTITLSNPNSVSVKLDNVTDDLPAGFTYRAGTTTGVTTSDPTIMGQHLQWNGPFTVPANGSVSLRFGVRAALQAGVYYNDAGGDAGAVVVKPAENTAPVTVFYESTVLTARAAVLEVGSTLHVGVFRLQARLTFATGDPVFGETVEFHAGSTYLGSATTDLDGVATFSALGSAQLIVAEHGYTAIFDGSACFQPSTDDAPVVHVLGNDVP